MTKGESVKSVSNVEEYEEYIKKYKIMLPDVMKSDHLRALLKNYAIDICKCPETFSFLESVETFSRKYKNSPKEALLEAQKIVRRYIRENSELEINVGHDIKKDIKEKVGKAVREKTPLSEEVFSAASSILSAEFLFDVFPRFWRSEQFRNHILSNGGENYLKLITGDCGGETELTSADMKGEVTINDSKIIESLAADGNQWKMIRASRDFGAYYTGSKFKVEDKSNSTATTISISGNQTRFFKCTGVVPYHMDDVLRAITNPSLRSYLDHPLSTTNTFKYKKSLSPGSLSQSYTYETLPLVWPLVNRDFVQCNSIFYDSKFKRYYIIKKSCDNDSMPEKKGSVRGTCYSGWILIYISNHKTRYVYVSHMDVKGASAQALFKGMMKRRLLAMEEGMKSCLRDAEKLLFERPFDTFGLMDTLDDFQKKNFFNKISNHLGSITSSSSTSSSSPSSLLTSSTSSSEKVFSENQDFLSSKKCNVKRVAYISRYDPNVITPNEIANIGRISVQNNKKINVTGMLLFCNGVFYQVIEGESSTIDKLYAKISKDNRHYGAAVLKEETGLQETDRQYPSWNMNTINLEEQSYFFAKTMVENASSVLDKMSPHDISQVREDCSDTLTHIVA